MTIGELSVRVWAAVIAVVLLVVGVIVAWQVGWIFTTANTDRSLNLQQHVANRQYQIQQSGLSNQVTLREQISKGLAQLTAEEVQIAAAAGNPGLVGTLKVEASAQAGTLCQEGAEVSSAVAYPADERAWFRVNCSLGVLAPTSQYYISAAP